MKTGTVELEIERVVAGGFGLARTPDGVVLVRGALPGERVMARPRAVGGVLRAYAMDIVEPHPARVDLKLPPGADLPLEYDIQLPIKHGLVAEALIRIAKMPDVEVEPVVPSPASLGYRTVAQYFVSPQFGLGAMAVDSDRVVGLSADPLIAPPLATAFAAASERPLHGIEEIVLRGSLHEDACIVGMIGSGKREQLDRMARHLSGRGVAGVVLGEPSERGRFRGHTRLLAGRADLLEDLGGITASVNVGSFSQVNPLAAGAMFVAAAEAAGSGKRALDLYAGNGILGMHLARSFEEVVAIEIVPDAVRRGEMDARRLGVTNISFKRADARTAGPSFPFDVVVVDPPRAGLSTQVVDLFAQHKPARIVYVSCDPSTWARDVARLGASGYRLSSVQPYDLYPYTHHVEIVSVLDLV